MEFEQTGRKHRGRGSRDGQRGAKLHKCVARDGGRRTDDGPCALKHRHCSPRDGGCGWQLCGRPPRDDERTSRDSRTPVYCSGESATNIAQASRLRGIKNSVKMHPNWGNRQFIHNLFPILTRPNPWRKFYPLGKKEQVGGSVRFYLKLNPAIIPCKTGVFAVFDWHFFSWHRRC